MRNAKIRGKKIYKKEFPIYVSMSSGRRKLKNKREKEETKE